MRRARLISALVAGLFAAPAVARSADEAPASPTAPGDAAPGPAAPTVVDRVVALVDDAPVTLYELRRAASPFLSAARRKGHPPEVFGEKAREVVGKALDSLVDDLLIFAQAKKMELEVDHARVDAHLEQLRTRNGWDEDELPERLRDLGYASVNDYRRFIEREQLKAQVVSARVLSRARADEREVEAELARELGGSGRLEERRASHVILLLPELASAEDEREFEARLTQARAAIVAGETSFADVARELSEDASNRSGGDLGWFVRGDMDPAFEEVVYNLREGEVSPVFRTQFGLHLATLTGTRRQELSSPEQLEAARRRIRVTLRDREVERIYRQWLRGLRAAAFVSVRPDLGL
jgi:parvulin-like peptidyl-prolyl isomerase